MPTSDAVRSVAGKLSCSAARTAGAPDRLRSPLPSRRVPVSLPVTPWTPALTVLAGRSRSLRGAATPDAPAWPPAARAGHRSHHATSATATSRRRPTAGAASGPAVAGRGNASSIGRSPDPATVPPPSRSAAATASPRVRVRGGTPRRTPGTGSAAPRSPKRQRARTSRRSGAPGPRPDPPTPPPGAGHGHANPRRSPAPRTAWPQQPLDVLRDDRLRPGLPHAPKQLRPQVPPTLYPLCTPPRLHGWHGTPPATTSTSPSPSGEVHRANVALDQRPAVTLPPGRAGGSR